MNEKRLLSPQTEYIRAVSQILNNFKLKIFGKERSLGNSQNQFHTKVISQSPSQKRLAPEH